MKSISNRKHQTAHRRHARIPTKIIGLLILSLFITVYSFSQPVAYLDFKNPVLQSGAAGADGAVYRFVNVANNVDAIVTIDGRSDGLVYMLNPDMNTAGFDGAFQPQVGYNSGTAPGAVEWWMQFTIQFVNSGTATPVAINDFNVSGVDIDGNGQYINEYVAFFGMNDYSIESATGLSITTVNENIGGNMVTGKRFDGPTANYTNIDTSATAVMVTNHYVNTTSFTVRTGARATDVSGASDRMYSFYFQNFSYNSPSVMLLALNSARLKPARVNNNTILKVFPNPSSGNITVTIPDAWKNDNISLSIYNTNGVLVSASAYTMNDKINLSALKSGVYMIHLTRANESYVNRIVKM